MGRALKITFHFHLLKCALTRPPGGRSFLGSGNLTGGFSPQFGLVTRGGLKYPLVPSYGHAQVGSISLLLRDFRLCYRQFSHRLPILDKGRFDDVDWSAYRRRGRIRLYWTLFGGDYPFFRREEDKAAHVPKLSIEYDPDQTARYSPELTGSFIRLERDGSEIDTVTLDYKILKVSIKNTGPAIAKNCTATLKALSAIPGAPSDEPKKLIWENDTDHADISALGGDELLNVTMSINIKSKTGATSILLQPESKAPKAFVFTKLAHSISKMSLSDTLSKGAIIIFPAQDGIDEGKYDFELIVRSGKGVTATAKLRVHATKDWHQLGMEIIAA